MKDLAIGLSLPLSMFGAWRSYQNTKSISDNVYDCTTISKRYGKLSRRVENMAFQVEGLKKDRKTRDSIEEERCTQEEYDAMIEKIRNYHAVKGLSTEVQIYQRVNRNYISE